jgi:predicted DNA-binding helix-hairpin-helix protein
MDQFDRLQLLSDMMHLEPAEEVGCQPLSAHQQRAINISHAVTPGGKPIPLLKTLLTSACERNCFYCPFRAGRDFRRATFKPDELAQTFIAIHRAGLAEGMFLSSGITAGGVRSQDALLDTAAILRNKLGFKGYLHLKLMPGVEYEQVRAAMQYSDRISVNLEAPNTARLEKLAPRKAFMEELLQPMRYFEQIRRDIPGREGWKGRWPSLTTQFVVGAVGESDLELLATTEFLHRQMKLSRAYYSRFTPIEDTPFENYPAESPVREQRLYQASFLLRDYGFNLEELSFTQDGRLPLDRDPKQAWASANLSEKPLEINRASKEELLRIPGFGPKSVAAILKHRRRETILSLDDLKKIGILTRRAEPYILLNGKRSAQQLQLFALD